MDEIKKKIEQELKKRGLHMYQLSEMINYRRGTLSQVLQRRKLTVEKFLKIAEVLDMKPSDLLPSKPENLLIKMPLIDLIKHIVKEELDKNCELLCKKEGEEK